MRIPRRIAVGCIATALVIVFPASAQTIHGIVQDERTSEPIPAALVTLFDNTGAEVVNAATGQDGRFALEATLGKYYFIVRRIGYQPTTTTSFTVPADAGRIEVTILVPPAEVVLPGVTVEGEEVSAVAAGRLRGFYTRSERGWGTFLTPEQIRERAPSKLTDLLAEVAGVRVSCGGLFGGNQCYVEMTRQAPRVGGGYDANITNYGRGSRGEATRPGGTACPVSYYLDGAKYRPGEIGINELSVTGVLAVEVYRGASETPAEFLDSDSRCGVIAIWTGSAAHEAERRRE